MKAPPKDEQYPLVVRSGRRLHSDAMWLLLMICGIVLTMWVLDETVERVTNHGHRANRTLRALSSAFQRNAEPTLLAGIAAQRATGVR